MQVNHQVTQKQTVALELSSEVEGAKGPRGPVAPPPLWVKVRK